MPKGYIIGHITVRDPEAYKEYIVRDTPILQGLAGHVDSVVTFARGGKRLFRI
jgi:uncharacterized protein (DUF1330 family)